MGSVSGDVSSVPRPATTRLCGNPWVRPRRSCSQPERRGEEFTESRVATSIPARRAAYLRKRVLAAGCSDQPSRGYTGRLPADTDSSRGCRRQRRRTARTAGVNRDPLQAPNDVGLRASYDVCRHGATRERREHDARQQGHHANGAGEWARPDSPSLKVGGCLHGDSVAGAARETLSVGDREKVARASSSVTSVDPGDPVRPALNG